MIETDVARQIRATFAFDWERPRHRTDLAATLRRWPKCMPATIAKLTALVPRIEVTHAKCSHDIAIVSGCRHRLRPGKEANPHHPFDIADAGGDEPWLLRGSARRYHRQYRSRQHRHVAGRRRFGAAMGCQHLYHCVCRLHSHSGRVRRPRRCQACFHGGFRHFHRRIARLCAGAQCHDPDRGAGRAGTWRSHSGSELAGVAEPRLSGCKAARPCGRNLGRRRQPCAHRPARLLAAD